MVIVEKRGYGRIDAKRMGAKSQISIEYMTIVGIFFILMIPVIYFGVGELNNQIALAQADDAVRILKESADRVYALGPGSRIYSYITLPGSVDDIYFQGKEIVINISVFGGSSQITRTTLANITGVLRKSKGTYKVQFETLTSGFVFIGTNDTTPPQVISTNPSGSINTNSTTLTATTDEDSTCKYCNATVCTADTNFTTMILNMSGSKDVHTAESGLLIDGTYTYYVRCLDGANNAMNTSATISFTVDRTVPVISSVTSHTITNSTASVNWTTDESSDSRVHYGTTSALGADANDTALVTLHQVNLSNLLNGTLYYYKVESCDNVANCANSSLFNFTTKADNIPPVISNVRNHSITNSTVNIMWDTDENANSTVYYAQNLSLASIAGNSTLSTLHNVTLTGLRNGTLYYYNVSSCDINGNCAVSGIYNFTTTQNPDIIPPNITNVTASPNPVQRRGFINFTANVTDAGGVNIVYLQIQGVNYTMIQSSSVDIYYYDTYIVNKSGTLNYTIFAKDNAGNSATSAGYVFTSTRGTMIVFYDSTPAVSQTPAYRQWNLTNWSASNYANSVGADAKEQYVLAPSPHSDEKILGLQDGDIDVSAQVWDGDSWGAVTEFTTSASDAATRRGFDIAYEQSSGRAVAVYRSQNNLTVPSYRIWNGTGWTAEARTLSIGAGNINWMRLVPKPSSNEMILVTMDANLDIWAQVWNGTAWNSNISLEISTENVAYQTFDVAYEQQTGRAIAAWQNSTLSTPMYRIWNSTNWSAVGTASATSSANIRWLGFA